jgi:hypothetical protein
MFATQSYSESYKKLIALTKIENSAMLCLEEDIQCGGLKQSRAENRLKDYSACKVFKFGEHSKWINDFCQEERSFTAEWAGLLKQGGTVYTHTQSIDKKDSCSVANQYMAAYLLKQAKTLEKSEPTLASFCLSKACELGAFNALYYRIQKNSDLIAQRLPISENIRKEFYDDIERISNLYWAAGHGIASVILINISTAYYNASDTEIKSAALVFQIAAAEKFFCARLLMSSHLTTSDELLNAICKEKGMKLIGGFESWSQASDFILQGLSQKQRDDTFIVARTKIKSALNPSNSLPQSSIEHKL